MRWKHLIERGKIQFRIKKNRLLSMPFMCLVVAQRVIKLLDHGKQVVPQYILVATEIVVY